MNRDVLNSTCRLCSEKAVKKYHFFSERGKSLKLTQIISKICDVSVEENDLPKFCCRSCHDKLMRLKKNMEDFSAVCNNAQKVLETRLLRKRIRHGTGKTPISSEKGPKQVCITQITTACTARKSLMFHQDSSPMDTSATTLDRRPLVVEQQEVGREFILSFRFYCVSINKCIVFIVI